jgi:Glycosyltransferase family 87
VSHSIIPARWATLARKVNTPAGIRVLMSIFVIVAVIFSVVPLVHYFRGQSTKDYALWYDTGRRVLAGDEVFYLRLGKFDFMYPPPCAVFLAGASLDGRAGLIFLLVTINSVAWWISARYAAVLASGQRHVTNIFLYAVPSLLVLVYIWSNYHLGQPSLVLLALMLGSFAALRAKREILAGALVAFAAVIKAFPVVAIIYLIYRRHWRAAASLTVTVALLLIVLPAPLLGFQRAWRDVEKWSAGMLKYDANGVAQRPMRSYTWKNQSIFGVANRLLRHIDIDATTPPDQPVYANLVDIKFSTVNVIIVGAALALGILFIAAVPPPGTRTSESDSIEFALLILLMLIFTPLSFGYLFSWLMFPFAVILQMALTGKRILGWSALALAIFALALPFPRQAQAYGNTFFATLLLFFGLTIELWRCKRPAGQAEVPVSR